MKGLEALQELLARTRGASSKEEAVRCIGHAMADDAVRRSIALAHLELPHQVAAAFMELEEVPGLRRPVKALAGAVGAEAKGARRDEAARSDAASDLRRAAALLFEWAAANQEKFWHRLGRPDAKPPDGKDGWFGRWETGDGWTEIGFRPDLVEDLQAERGFDSKHVLKGWRARGWRRVDDKGSNPNWGKNSVRLVVLSRAAFMPPIPGARSDVPRPASVPVAVAGAAATWLDSVEDPGNRKVLAHLEAHGAITEAEVREMLKSGPAARRFAAAIDGITQSAPFRVRVEITDGVKRYVRENE